MFSISGVDITQQVIERETTQNPPKKCLTTQPVMEFVYNATYVQKVSITVSVQTMTPNVNNLKIV